MMPIEPLPVSQNPELVFGLVAPIGVNLGVVADALTETLRDVSYHTQLIRLTSLMSALEHGPAATPQTSQSHIYSYTERIRRANDIRREYGDHALAAVAISAIRSFRSEEWQRRITLGIPTQQGAEIHPEEEPLPKQSYIIWQLKRPDEIMLLRQVYGRQFILLSAYASQEWRIKRLTLSEKESRGGLVSDVDAQNKATALVLQDAKEHQDSHGQNVRDAFPLGDVFIDATSRVKCEVEIRRFIRLLFGNNEISPTHDEYGMYIAKSASLRSSDLSRQVGAAIFRPSGEVLTLGCNEVPKFGGGTYWAGDAGDARDFVQGSDPNETRKVQVLVDLIDRLHKSRHLSAELMSMSDTHSISRILLSEKGQDAISDSKVMDLVEFGRIVHAEMSALSDAARKGISVEGATLFCTTFPCHLCAKLIVAAGIKSVVYLEPYPKSYASDLHGDAISVDADACGDKVAFRAFLGVSPFRYRDLFEKRKRKDSSGNAQRWNDGVARPLLHILYPSYFRAEAYVVSLLGNAIKSSTEVSPENLA